MDDNAGHLGWGLTSRTAEPYLSSMISFTGRIGMFAVGAMLLGGAVYAGGGTDEGSDTPSARVEEASTTIVVSPENATTAVFAGGCFWCMEEAYEKVIGVIDAVSGYAGGTEVDPTYYDVASGTTGHAEVVQVIYDPELVTYDDLLNIFWRNIDLLDAGGQFCDRGSSYRTGVFYVTEEERVSAEASRRELEASGRFSLPIVTEITPLDVFYPAEGYHQNYYKTDPIRYQFYKTACGRVRRLEQLWGEEAGGAIVHK